MPSVTVNDIRFGYDELGDRANPTIVFTHSLLWDREMFADVVSELAGDYHIINLDQHGHGESGYRAGFTLEEMADDYAALLTALGLEGVHWAGLSMGGMTGMRLALRHPEKVRSLVLMNTSSKPEMEERREQYFQLAEALRAGQAAAVADVVLQFFFAPKTFAERPELVAHYKKKLVARQENEGIYQAGLAVFNRGDITDQLSEIDAPALVLAGEHDIATPPDRSAVIVTNMRRARLSVIPGAAHMSATEQPAAVVEEIREFLAQIG